MPGRGDLPLAAAPALLVAIMLVPIAAGLAATLLPAFGWFPALGGTALSLQPFHAFFSIPGLRGAVAGTLRTGLLATGLSLGTALALAVLVRRPGLRRVADAVIAPLLAVPHAALAIGLGFLIAPSGWIVRAISPGLTGWQVPPDLATVQDPFGGALVLALCVKEVPYLLLMTLAALAQVNAGETGRVAASLGYGPWRAWTLVVFPLVWPQLRLPVLAVLSFSLSVVDVALILGPDNPPTLSVLVLRLFSDPDLASWFPACAGAVLLAGIVLAALAGLLVLERGIAGLGRWVAARGGRGGGGHGADMAAAGAGTLLAALGAGGILVLAVWSVAASWRFPDTLPERWSGAVWRAQAPALAGPLQSTLAIGLAATLLAVLLSVLCLENERRIGHRPRRALALLYLPLLVPQLAFLSGMQQALVRLDLDGGALALVWAHLVFVLPYVFLSLADPWRALDPRLLRSAACLGAPPWRVRLLVTLPLLARPLLASAAVGFAVSVGLYLPTLFAGAGRVATLTTAAVTLASGGDRRVVGATALLQAVLPLLFYGLVAILPAWRARRRRAAAMP